MNKTRGLILVAVVALSGCSDYRDDGAPTNNIDQEIAKAFVAGAEDLPALLPCVVTLARSPALHRYHWDGPRNCNDEPPTYPVTKYHVEMVFEVPDTNLIVFVMNGRNMRFRVNGELSNGMRGCAPGDTSWSEWSVIE